MWRAEVESKKRLPQFLRFIFPNSEPGGAKAMAVAHDLHILIFHGDASVGQGGGDARRGGMPTKATTVSCIHANVNKRNRIIRPSIQ